MKLYHFLFLGLVSLSLHANSPRIIENNKKTPLMVSHLSPNLIKSVHLKNNLSYAVGHTFYDTPITLSDETGHTIHFQEDMDVKKNYTITSLGQTTETLSMIWFFSPEGSYQTYSERTDVCPAENPCKQLTQNLIDGISHSENIQNLWFATGSYELPLVKQQVNKSHLIEFNRNQHVFGRTSGFRHIAYANDRPLFSGTLSWNAYSGHKGSQNFVENIRVDTHSNYTEVENFSVDTNLHSAGRLIIRNCALNKVDGMTSHNVIAKKVFVEHSDLYAESEFEGANIEANEIDLSQSNLTMKGLLGSNITAQVGALAIYESTLLLYAEGCNGTALNLNHTSDVEITYSKIHAKTENECSHGGILSGLEENNRNTNLTRLTGSEITVFSKYGNACAFLGNKSIQLNGSTIVTQSLQGKANATCHVGQIEFLNNRSHVSIASPLSGEFFENAHTVLNQSKFPSLCRINDGDFEECKLN